MISTKRALVLAGGGVAGIAWETGFLLGLQDEAPALVQRLLTHSTTLVGTSAGSTVAAQISSGESLQGLFDRQIAATTTELSATIDLAQLGGMIADATNDAASAVQVRQRLGTLALKADTPPAAMRRAVIEARLTTHEWSGWPLLISAVDTSTGELRVFDRTSGTNLVDVVAASCAVPGVWPPVEIEGRLYMDGGARSLANADLAAGAEQVLILVPSPAETPLGVAVPDEQLRALDPARVLMINADAVSQEAMGVNPLDPESRIPAARAGRDQGRRVAAEIDAFWS
ncbi:patatin-like phospholipase family protein [Sinomonas sp. ASV486]|uniref:patatin-like phospholipase family protein n=1 Tax=Sinomonas sp. ASV486 TaxID=3051170 RepID=UPI0027DCDD73|nr:patatin-like phospholipase family protein [Sinomonas sp. ASV486]MDQ4489055.1 patatin-like phospholipase family protein [Sinomonas sp. ASV486]